MTPAGARVLLLAAATLAFAAGGASAGAQVQGPCTVAFNGIEAGRIDSLSSPLLLGDDEALVFSGTDEAGTRHATVSVLLGPASLGRGRSSSAGLEREFTTSLDLADVAPYGVGLVRIRAATDNCTVEAWLRIGGRLPFTTLVGLSGTGLALAGLTSQVTALAVRRRWSVPVAAAGGVATGMGGALLGQQSGRLQISYWSLGLAVALAALIGLALALVLRPRGQQPEGRRARGADEAPPPEVGTPREPAASTPPAAVTAAAAASRQAVAEAAPPARQTASGPFWCYVMSEVEVLDLDDYTRVVAALHPGTWYLAKREVGGWAQVAASEAIEGWVPRQALHREG